MFKETVWLQKLSMVLEMTVGKNSTQTVPQVVKVTVQKLVLEFWTVTSNNKVNKNWSSAYFLFLIKNIKWNGFH